MNMDRGPEPEPYRYYDHLIERGLSPEDTVEIFKRYLGVEKEKTGAGTELPDIETINPDDDSSENVET